jgi:hypothetical protein
MAIEMGKIATDSITGFKGIAVIRTEYLFGCARWGLKPKELKDGLPQDIVYFDEKQLKEYDPARVPASNKWLSQMVTDSITGIKGKVTSATSYLYMAPRICITPKGTFEGKPFESIDCDEASLKEYKTLEVVDRTGGPGDKAPLQFSAPRG